MPSSRVSESTVKKGKKPKIEIKKRETKEQRAVTCSKHRQTIFSKAGDLCLLSGANRAVFITCPSESSDVVYSFSDFSPAYVIADSYLKNKPPPKIVNPQSKLGFWWEDPDLYHSCDDLYELNIIEDRIKKVKKHVMDCLEKKEKSQFVSDSVQNPSTCSLDEDCGESSSQIVPSFGPNPSSFVYDSCGDQNLNSSSQSSSLIVSFDQNSYPSLDLIYGESSSHTDSFDPNSSSEIQGCETEELNNQINLFQETQTQTVFNLDDESFWDDLFNDNVFGPNGDYCVDTTNDMINLGEFKECDLEWLDSSQFTD